MHDPGSRLIIGSPVRIEVTALLREIHRFLAARRWRSISLVLMLPRRFLFRWWFKGGVLEGRRYEYVNPLLYRRWINHSCIQLPTFSTLVGTLCLLCFGGNLVSFFPRNKPTGISHESSF